MPHDIESQTIVIGVLLESEGGTTSVLVPVIAHGNVSAVMAFRGYVTFPDNQALISVMDRIGSQIARVVERDELQRAIEESVHLEQQTLTGDLHDGLGHELAGLTWLAHSHLLQLQEGNPTLADSAERLHSGMRSCLSLLRQTLKGLASLSIGPGGFVPAIASLVSESESRSDCRVELDCNFTVMEVAEFNAAQIYRIIQESLTNVIKHSQADYACVTIIQNRDRITISVTDNGCGCTELSANDNGLGFDIMRHRARLIGGDLTIRPGASGGLQILLEAPTRPGTSISKQASKRDLG